MILTSPDIEVREDFGVLLNTLCLQGEAVEIGTHLGLFAGTLLSKWTGARLHCIDPWCDDMPDYKDTINGRDRERDYQICCAYLARYKRRIHLIREVSANAVSQFDDNSLCFVYIDGNHRQDYVLQDIEIWYPKVHSEGIIAGHDLNHEEFGRGISLVVNRFFNAEGVNVYCTQDEPSSWYARKP